MRCAWVAIAVGLSGCSALLGIDDFQTATPSDAAGDGTTNDGADAPTDAFVIDTPPGSPCFGTLSPVCFATVPVGAVMLVGAINTDTDLRCQVRTQVGGPDLCVIAASTLTIGAGVSIGVTGSRPLVLVGADTITIQGVLNASSQRGGPIGAGANVLACAGPGGTDGGNEGGGGGAGGTLGQRGGSGGAGANGALPGVSTTVVSITAIRGGCAGGRGGRGDLGTNPPGGSSGGAIALVAGTQVQIALSGGVFASGAGGSSNAEAGNAKRAAGGGGGSGGLIVLDAPVIEVLGTITANGGGGGGGARDGTATAGGDGATTSYSQSAQGGAENSTGGPGGDGGAIAATAMNGGGGQSQAGGGGGGAGAGVIWVKGSLTGTRISPPIQQH